jgi:hypothetical protein
LVFKKSTAVHLFFYLAGFFLFGVGEIYSTLTLLAILTSLSFRFFYGLSQPVLFVSRLNSFLSPWIVQLEERWQGKNHSQIPRPIPDGFPLKTSLHPCRPRIPLQHAGVKAVCDKATTVHKISTNMKKMSKAP